MRLAELFAVRRRALERVVGFLLATMVMSCGDRTGDSEAGSPGGQVERPSSADVGILHCGLGNEPEIRDASVVSDVPARISAAESVAFWSTWKPGVLADGASVGESGPGAVASWTARAVDAWSGVATPLGLFVHRVATVDALRRADGVSVVAACVSFDPRQRSSGLLPLAPEDQAILRSALESGLLTPEQRGVLERVREAYLERWSRFQERWNRFVSDPRDDMRRDLFFDALVALPGEVSSLAQHDRFLTRPQRTALRRVGHVIDGAAWSGEDSGGRRVVVRNYPAGVFVDRWNGLPAFLGLPAGRPHLLLADGASYDEIDLELLLPVADDSAQLGMALRVLASIPQLRLGSDVR